MPLPPKPIGDVPVNNLKIYLEEGERQLSILKSTFDRRYYEYGDKVIEGIILEVQTMIELAKGQLPLIQGKGKK